MRIRNVLAGAIAPAIFAAGPVLAEPVVWGVQVEQLEYRAGDGPDLLAWDFDAFAGRDEIKFLWRSEAEFALREDAFETLENQARLQTPVSDFFDAVAGIRVSTPEGPDRVHGVVGLHGLAPQWFEIDADLFLSDEPFFRFEADYEALITNRIILTPTVEFELPFTDDRAVGVGAWGPKLEVGARLSYDLIDRALSPYIGVHYERVFAETADLARDEDEDVDGLFFVAGVRIVF